MSAIDTTALGRPIKGPSALGTDRRRLAQLSVTLAVMEFKLRFFGSVLGYLWQLMRPLLSSTQINEVINGKDVKAVKVVPVPSEKCQNRLNEQVLMSKYIDMLKEHGDSLIVVPQGTSNLLQLPTAPGATPKAP